MILNPTNESGTIIDVSNTSAPTIWGLTPYELHDRFWASRGVQVVRPGQPSEIVEGAELFLMMPPHLLMIYRLRRIIEELSWIQPDLLWVRVRNKREERYREIAVTDDQSQLIRFDRIYGGSNSRPARTALTPHANIARLWQTASTAREGWQALRQQVPSARRTVTTIAGHTYLRNDDYDVMQFIRDLIDTWKRPDTTIERARKHQLGVWVDSDSHVKRTTEFVGSAWIGAGREITNEQTVIGPAALWDSPEARPRIDSVNWNNLEPTKVLDQSIQSRPRSTLDRQVKRIFDIAFATTVLLLVVPLWPMIMLAIWLEDGLPIFFAHRRETSGGRTFPCLKFRSMRRNAEEIKSEIKTQNTADGPQFFVPDDPRLTQVGRFLRKFHLDELPQFLNVLAGHMSIVGPRPSPYLENQYSPAWREARLSVLPGITGLWQVKRTRKKGLDFQEWIKYDIEYVERSNFLLDLAIIWQTFYRYFVTRN